MCDRCNQTGAITSVETVEHFGGAYRMPVTMMCDCLADGLCPRCDVALVPVEDEPGMMICPECELMQKMR